MFAKSVWVSHCEMVEVKGFCDKIMAKQAKPGSRDYINKDMGKNRITNNMIGKFGEVGAAKVTKGVVDFKVWSSGSRGKDQFEPDITGAMDHMFKGFNIHVKTCNAKHGSMRAGRLYPDVSASWTVDVNDPVFRRPCNNDIIVLMFASDKGRVFVLGWIKATVAMRLWRPCKSVFMSHKKAIYFSDVAPLVTSI
jgi:hypothetical protein